MPDDDAQSVSVREGDLTAAYYAGVGHGKVLGFRECRERAVKIVNEMANSAPGYFDRYPNVAQDIAARLAARLEKELDAAAIAGLEPGNE